MVEFWGERIGVFGAFHVAAASWVSIPKPSSADIAAGFGRAVAVFLNGDAITDMGNPFGASTSLTPGGVSGGGQAGGYSIINADSLDDATKKADGCPVLASGGNVEIYEAVAM